jgi:hypothetical protein
MMTILLNFRIQKYVGSAVRRHAMLSYKLSARYIIPFGCNSVTLGTIFSEFGSRLY